MSVRTIPPEFAIVVPSQLSSELSAQSHLSHSYTCSKVTLLPPFPSHSTDPTIPAYPQILTSRSSARVVAPVKIAKVASRAQERRGDLVRVCINSPYALKGPHDSVSVCVRAKLMQCTRSICRRDIVVHAPRRRSRVYIFAHRVIP